MLLKKISSKLPLSLQQELKRHHYFRQIKKGSFVSDEPEFSMLSKWIREGDWVIDIGANVGHYSLEFSRLVGNTGRVISFEPVLRNFELLASNLRTAGNNNVTLLNLGASSSWAEVGMEIPNFKSGLNNLYQAKISEKATANKIVTCPVDMIDAPKPIKLIKIDVEGHEFSAVSGLTKILEKHSPVLIVEGDVEEVNSAIMKFGYSKMVFENSPNVVFEKK